MKENRTISLASAVAGAEGVEGVEGVSGVEGVEAPGLVTVTVMVSAKVTEESFKNDRVPENIIKFTYTVDLSGVHGENLL